MIQQIFHLPNKLIKQIEKSEKPLKYQLKIESSTRIIKEKCRFNLIDIELTKIEDISKTILKQYNKAIIIGIGGAILSSRAFTASQNYTSNNFSLIYSDSLVPQKQASIFTKKNLQTAAIIIISRSGNSIETLSQTYAAINKYRQYFGEDYPLGKHFFIITKESNGLSKIGHDIKAQMIEYTSSSGKFASFSAVGLLPARLIGLDLREIILGGQTILANPCDAIKAATINYYLLKQGYSINVMSYYNDLFDQLSLWHSQIASEIVAKQGKGFTPLVARGIFDQHGLWQMLLAGQHDKYFTFLCNQDNYQDNQLNTNIETTYHQLTLKRLKRQNMPARELIIDSINSKNLGALTMTFLLELTCLANLLNISPLTQPFIDQNKKLMKQLITKEYLEFETKTLMT